MQSLGVLIWLMGPLITSLLLRWLGGDGWKDFGLLPNFRKGWQWYLVTLLVVFFIPLLIIWIGIITGAMTAGGFVEEGLAAFLALLGINFAGSMVKNIFEEFAWRGYLAPRLEFIQRKPVINAVITGLIWASWHIPYYLFFLSKETLQAQTTLSATGLIVLSFFILPVQSLLYNELRQLSKTVWTAWLLHTLSNAASFALITGGFVILSGKYAAFFLTPSTEGILYALLMGVSGWALYKYRLRLQVEGGA